MTTEDAIKFWRETAPEDWPHTPPLEIFLALEKEDRHLFWRVSSGHIENLLEEAVETIKNVPTIDELKAELKSQRFDPWVAYGAAVTVHTYLKKRAGL